MSTTVNRLTIDFGTLFPTRRSHESPRGAPKGGTNFDESEGCFGGGKKEGKGRGLQANGADPNPSLGGKGPSNGGVQDLLRDEGSESPVRLGRLHQRLRALPGEGGRKVFRTRPRLLG